MIRRFALTVAAVAVMACAEGDQSDESGAQKPLVKCDGTRLPSNGDRCDNATTPPDAYCRTNDCRTQCEDECRCNNGRWECFVFCRDGYGCGTLPLCGVGCGGSTGADAATGG